MGASRSMSSSRHALFIGLIVADERVHCDACAKAEGLKIHWGDETALVNADPSGSGVVRGIFHWRSENFQESVNSICERGIEGPNSCRSQLDDASPAAGTLATSPLPSFPA